MIIYLMEIAIRIVKYILYHHTHHHISPYILIIEPCIQACLLNNFIESRPMLHYHICRIALSCIAYTVHLVQSQLQFCIMEGIAIDHNNTNVCTFTFKHMHIFAQQLFTFLHIYQPGSCSHFCTFLRPHIFTMTTLRNCAHFYTHIFHNSSHFCTIIHMHNAHFPPLSLTFLHIY